MGKVSRLLLTVITLVAMFSSLSAEASCDASMLEMWQTTRTCALSGRGGGSFLGERTRARGGARRAFHLLGGSRRGSSAEYTVLGRCLLDTAGTGDDEHVWQLLIGHAGMHDDDDDGAGPYLQNGFASAEFPGTSSGARCHSVMTEPGGSKDFSCDRHDGGTGFWGCLRFMLAYLK